MLGQSIIIISLSLLIYSRASLSGIDVIYGEDNRKEIYELHDPKLAKLSQSIAIRVHESKMTTMDEKSYQISSDPVSAEFGLNICSDQKYADQQTIGSCSGFLIAPGLLVTAGHCMADENEVIYDQNNFYCSDYKWVFDYKMKSSSDLHIDLGDVVRRDIYECESVVHAVFFENFDIALIKLKRPVTNRAHLKLNLQNDSVVGDSLFTIGHPIGLPMKFTNNANIFEAHEPYFLTNLDVFTGNSGSPVFNEKTGDVIGVVSSGMTDFNVREELVSTCQEVNVCDSKGENCTVTDNDARGEQASSISLIKDFLNL